MKWRVEISYVAKDDRLLRQLLADKSFELIDENQTFYLVGNEFEALNSHTDVYALADRIQSIVEETDKWEPLVTKFDVRCVFEEVENGNLKKYGRSHVISFNAICNSAIVSASIKVNVSEEEQRRFEEEQKELDYQKRYRTAKLSFASSLNDERALDVQRLLRNELTPLVMGHIFDIIEDDMGGVLNELTSNTQKGRFTRSINHPKVFGEQARHIVSKHEPPPQPMDLGEAREYIKNVALKWLERKANLNVNK